MDPLLKSLSQEQRAELANALQKGVEACVAMWEASERIEAIIGQDFDCSNFEGFAVIHQPGDQYGVKEFEQLL